MSASKDTFGINVQNETVTPHKICVAIFIRQYCLFLETSRYRNLNPVTKARYRKDFCLISLKLIQSPDMSLPELLSFLKSGKYEIEPRFLQSFEFCLQDLNNVGLNYLLELSKHISNLITESCSTLGRCPIFCQIYKYSVLGCYLRRLMLSFNKLSFSEVAIVFDGFKEYYKKYSDTFDINIIKQQFSTTFEINDPEKSLLPFPSARYTMVDHWSKRQAQLFISTQAVLLSNNPGNALEPPQLAKQIQNLLKYNPDLAEAHFLSYLNYLRVKEFCGAIDSLYHCFDRSSTSDETSKGFRYAALNLAVLYYHFGHKQEALLAIKEAIMMAQESNDNICLQHALAWTHKITNDSKNLVLKHGVIKSMELNLPYLTSLGIQEYTQYSGLSGGNPTQIFATMTESDVLNCQHTFMDLMSNNYLQRSCLWLVYGKKDMSNLWNQLLLFLNCDNLTVGNSFRNETTCQSICGIANNMCLEGEYALALLILKFARDHFSHEPISHSWIQSEALVIFYKNLHNSDWLAAENAATQLASVNQWESVILMGELHITSGNFLLAQDCVDKITDFCSKENQFSDANLTAYFKIRALILQTELMCASGSLSNIISILNTALALSEEYNFDYFYSLIQLHIAHVHLLLDMSSQALKILDLNLVAIMTHGGCYDRARAMLLYGKCLVANSVNKKNDKRAQIIFEVCQVLNKCTMDFAKIESRSRVRDVLYLQATLYNEIGRTEERNIAAFEFNQHQKNFPTISSKTLITSL